MGAPAFTGTERYLVVRRLGAGGMGVVYEAFDRERNGAVALKMLRHLDAASIYRFKGEFRALSDVSHPNLATLHELQCVDGQWFFTMELVHGINFLSYVRRGYELSHADTMELEAGTLDARGPSQLDVPRLRAALAQLAEGVSALHQAGKLHRDIKPSNVLVTEAGRVVLLDFGLVTSAFAPDARTSMEGLVGTAAYMAPEQAASAGVTPASDWYAVGAMLYEALTGQLPFEGRPLEIMMRKQDAEPPPPRAIAPETPADLDALCTSLLRRRPDERPSGPEIQDRLSASLPQPQRRHRPTMPSGSATRLVGRERHLVQLQEAFAHSAARPTLLFVHGHSGMGKSALVRRFLEIARDEAVVLTGRCYERESVPYKGFDRLIDELSTHLLGLSTHEVQALLPRDVATVARVFPVLRRVAVLANARRLEEIPDAQELRRRAFAGLRELLARIADRRRLVLYVDDLQWGDLDSASLLTELMRPPDAPPLLFIGCYRTEDAGNAAVRALPRGGAAQEIAVDQLTLDEARELARALLTEREGAAEHAEAIAREAGGSPFFVGELVRYVEVGANLSPGDVTLPRVLATRLSMLPEAARRLLQVLALHGRPLPPELALRAADLAPDDGALAQLRVNNLVRTRGLHGLVEPYHDRVRETVVALISPDEAQQAHARLAHALEAFGAADAEALAVHYRGAGDLERAGEWAEAAAAQAAEALAFDRAARLYRLALEYHPDDRTLHIKLGDALVNAGRGAEAARAYLAAQKGASPVEARILSRRAAEQLLFSGHVDEGRAHMREVLRALGMDLPRSQAQSLLSLVLGRARLRLRGFAHRERAAAEVAPELLERIDACWSVAHGFGAVDVLVSHQFHTRHTLLALQAGEPSRIARALAIEPTIACAGGDFSRAEALIEQATALAERIGDPYALGLVAMEAATVAFMRGDFARSRALFDRAERIFRESVSGASSELATTQLLRSGAIYYLGDLVALARGVPEQIRQAEERGDLFAALLAKISFNGLYWLINDDPDGGEREAEDALSRWSSDGFHIQHFAALTAQVHIDLYRGDGAAAWRRIEAQWRALSGSILFRVQSSRVEAHYLRGRAALAAALVDEPRRARLLAVVAEHARALGKAPLGHTPALALLLRAGGAAASGDRGAARALFDEAIARCERAELRVLAVAARHRRALLDGDEAGCRAAEESLRDQHVRQPARLIALFAPGVAVG